MKILSWNINSIRAHEQDFRKAMALVQPDICCVQEIRVREDQRTFPIKGYRSIMNPAEQSGNYGTGVFMKNSIRPRSVHFDFAWEGYDHQGRVLALEFDHFVLVNSYWPFSSTKVWLERRIDWNKHFQHFLHDLQSRKPIIVCGDMNIVNLDIDSFNLKAVKKAGCFFPEEHAAFDRLLNEEKLVDTYRELHPQSNATFDYKQKGIFSVWPGDDYRNLGQGYRVDYFLVSQSLLPNVISSSIQDDIWGSDHCPIQLEIDIQL